MDVIVRYSIPTRLDIQPFGTICSVIDDEGHSKLYIQLSTIEGESHWERMGEFLEKCFKPELESKLFIESCLEVYKNLYGKGAQ